MSNQPKQSAAAKIDLPDLPELNVRADAQFSPDDLRAALADWVKGYSVRSCGLRHGIPAPSMYRYLRKFRPILEQHRHYHSGWITVSKAVKGPTSKAPVRGTKQRRIRRIPVSDELVKWIERRHGSVTCEQRLHGPVPLFPNPSARNRERRWTANALREEWNRACE
jgi:hypothetical protein